MESIVRQYQVHIEATQSSSPGNVELLIFLILKFSEYKFDITLYLGHKSTIKCINDLNISNLKIVESSVVSTFLRSLRARSNTLFFCSYPPLVRHNNSIVYYHSAFFTNPYKFLLNKNLSFSIRISRVCINWLIKLFHRNVDVFFCQTKLICGDLRESFSGIKVIPKPFYNDLELINAKKTRGLPEFDFVYPATADKHKNHFFLFKAIEMLGKKRKVTLIVTLPFNNTDYVSQVNEVNSNLGYHAIINIGRVSKEEVLKYYMNSRALVFPSIEESLGLPLIEAAFLGVPIIASDLPYVYSVIENPIVFDPKDFEKIANTLECFLDGKWNDFKQKNKVKNQVYEIIDYFKK